MAEVTYCKHVLQHATEYNSTCLQNQRLAVGLFADGEMADSRGRIRLTALGEFGASLSGNAELACTFDSTSAAGCWWYAVTSCGAILDMGSQVSSSSLQ